MKSCELTNDNEKRTRKNIDYLSLVQSADSCLSAPAHPPHTAHWHKEINVGKLKNDAIAINTIANPLLCPALQLTH